MSRAGMNYVNDSAPLHFASAMNAPVTAVYCSTIPGFGFGPLSDSQSYCGNRKGTLLPSLRTPWIYVLPAGAFQVCYGDPG